MNLQKTFIFKIKESFSKDNFFVSNSNKLAHKQILTSNNSFQFLYLKGPLKSGKTHLGTIWQKNNRAIRFNYKKFDEIINSNQNIFIDNLFFKLNEEKIFHLINHIFNNNLNILITSDKFPNEYKFNLEELSSRLKSFNLLQIFNPDDDLILNLLLKLLYDRQIYINNDEVIYYIIKRINRTYIDIYNLIEKIDTLSLSRKREITIPLIKELL